MNLKDNVKEISKIEYIFSFNKYKTYNDKLLLIEGLYSVKNNMNGYSLDKLKQIKNYLDFKILANKNSIGNDSRLTNILSIIIFAIPLISNTLSLFYIKYYDVINEGSNKSSELFVYNNLFTVYSISAIALISFVFFNGIFHDVKVQRNHLNASLIEYQLDLIDKRIDSKGKNNKNSGSDFIMEKLSDILLSDCVEKEVTSSEYRWLANNLSKIELAGKGYGVFTNFHIYRDAKLSKHETNLICYISILDNILNISKYHAPFTDAAYFKLLESNLPKHVDIDKSFNLSDQDDRNELNIIFEEIINLP